MWRHVKEKRNFIKFDLRNVSEKNMKKHKRLVLRLEALYLVKDIFCLYFSPTPKLWSRKKVFKVFVFWRYSKTLMQNCNYNICKCRWCALIIKRVKNYWKHYIIKNVQQEMFYNELNLLRQNKSSNKSKKLTVSTMVSYVEEVD